MGSNYDSTLIKDSTLKMSDREVEEAAEKIFEKSAYEYGHRGYTGKLAEKLGNGIALYRGHSCNSIEEAEKCIKEDFNHDKWGPADVVPVKNVGWYIGGWCSS
jgi:hypothetical protein